MTKRQITPKTEEEFNQLLAQGFEVFNYYTRLHYETKEDGSGTSEGSVGYIFLRKGNEEIVVNCSELGELFSTRYHKVADIDKNYFTEFSGHSYEVETCTYDHFTPIRRPLIHAETINSNKIDKIIQFLKGYVETEIATYSKNHHGKNLFNIFSNALVITEIDVVDCEIYEKSKLDIRMINQLRENASKMQNCFAFSFFYIYSKSTKSIFHPDFFLGCILYDLKNQKTVSINLTSNYEECEKLMIMDGPTSFIHCCKIAFEQSIANKNFMSLMHVPLRHATYTPIPWLYFATLYPFDYGKSKKNRDFFINIPEFFTFGISKDLNVEDSFYYNNIKKNADGMALVRYDLVNGDKVDYQLRIDTSRGEEFMHIDYGYYLKKGEMTKILAHFPIDMDLVAKFSSRMFVSIITAGFYDPEFVGILKYKLKNISEMINAYRDLSLPLKIIHSTEESAKWLEENQLFDEYEKIFRNDKDIDMTKLYKISNKLYGHFGKAEDGQYGFSHNGMMVLVRKYKGDDPKTHFILTYLDRTPKKK